MVHILKFCRRFKFWLSISNEVWFKNFVKKYRMTGSSIYIYFPPGVWAPCFCLVWLVRLVQTLINVLVNVNEIFYYFSNISMIVICSIFKKIDSDLNSTSEVMGKSKYQRYTLYSWASSLQQWNHAYDKYCREDANARSGRLSSLQMR